MRSGDVGFLYCNGSDIEEINSGIFKRANILGTVRQTSGTPTGALIQSEMGTDDSFGNRTDCVRFADGMQIVSGNVRLTKETDIRLSGSVTFPRSFTDKRYQVTASFRPSNAADGTGTIAADSNLGPREILAPISGAHEVGSCAISAFSISSADVFSAGSRMYVDFIIIGRWF